MPIEQQQPGNVEAETQVFAKIMIPEQDPATIPGVPPVTPAPVAATPPTPAPAATTAAQERRSKSLTRRLARRILGPTLMTKK
ncbi:hypothetical protein SAMN04488564_11185 [Lentzea waywayandensis]|uniref:Uncharacterized protein n=1 Tax=Lentzea waywayandensis TaxID=84724 RepID=A0A1I6FCN9_9PSEU|nr:hypothetical protein [Lentzea waywayandensis]SFR27517.1 hypothetical protein SAMN04488564_11185 [Lentzea waywayandensis]